MNVTSVLKLSQNSYQIAIDVVSIMYDLIVYYGWFTTYNGHDGIVLD